MLTWMQLPFQYPVKSRLVNWQPWSVLKISGLPWRLIASGLPKAHKGLQLGVCLIVTVKLSKD
jgi:hypothetical protein